MEEMEGASMIHKLRNRHFYTWIVLALILPLGFMLAWRAVPEPLFGEIISHKRPSEAEIIELSEDHLIRVNALVDAENPGLEIILKTPLTVPGANIYLAADDSEDINLAQLLGQVDSKNSYYFSTGEQIKQGQFLLFYDPINKNVFHKISF